MQQFTHILGNFIYQGQCLKENQYISSKNQKFHAIMQADGNFVVYQTSEFIPANALWATATDKKGQGPYQLKFQEDGNIVLYDSQNHAFWNSQTFNNKRSKKLLLTDEGHLRIEDQDNHLVRQFYGPKAQLFRNELHAPGILFEEHYISSSNGQYHLIMQKDGNLVIYNSQEFTPNHATWASGTDGKGKGPYKLVMQDDGNLVLYDHHDHAHWHSDTYNQAGDRAIKLVLDNEGQIILRNNQDILIKKL